MNVNKSGRWALEKFKTKSRNNKSMKKIDTCIYNIKNIQEASSTRKTNSVYT